MIYTVLKRDGSKEPFNVDKIKSAIEKCLQSVRNNESYIEDANNLTKSVIKFIEDKFGTAAIQVEKIQDIIENLMMSEGWYKEARTFITYRNKHSELRFIKERANYIEKYSNDSDNAASNSEVDANANVQNKNIATLNSELYKKFNIELSRYRVTEKLKTLYGSDCDYIKNLENHIIYKHDEGSSAAIMPYCVAVSLYPFLLNGTSTLDKLKSEAPKHLESFAGQFNNLVFLLSSQFAGAVAFGEFFNVFNYYCVKDFGENYYTRENDVIGILKQSKITIKDKIQQIFQNIVYTLNQPAGNRSFQSPFSNFSYFDSNYWKALFGEFCYPDGTKPEWKAIDYLQRLFIHWFNNERTKTLLTFPVNI